MCAESKGSSALMKIIHVFLNIINRFTKMVFVVVSIIAYRSVFADHIQWSATWNQLY